MKVQISRYLTIRIPYKTPENIHSLWMLCGGHCWHFYVSSQQHSPLLAHEALTKVCSGEALKLLRPFLRGRMSKCPLAPIYDDSWQTRLILLSVVRRRGSSFRMLRESRMPRRSTSVCMSTVTWNIHTITSHLRCERNTRIPCVEFFCWGRVVSDWNNVSTWPFRKKFWGRKFKYYRIVWIFFLLCHVVID